MIESGVMLWQWSGDFIVITVCLLAGYMGYSRSYRISLLQLFLQFVSIAITYRLTIPVAVKIIGLIPKSISFDQFIPDSLYYFIKPQEDNIIPLIVFIIIYLFIFVIVKSILYVFGRNYEWHQYILRKLALHRYIDGGFSAILTILNAYTYVLVVLVLMAFPLFNLVGQSSISYFLIHLVPIISDEVDQFYEPYETLHQALQTYGEEASLIFDGTTIDLDAMEEMILKSPSLRTNLQQAYRELVPYIATYSGYMSQFSGSKIDTEEMNDYLTTIQNYLANQTINLEILNFYYEELINNKIYDILIEDEVITNDALILLIESGFLNDANLKKIKEYITLD